MKVMVTGAYGFVGGYLAAKLVEEGHEVLGVDLAAGSPEAGYAGDDGPAYRGSYPAGAEYARCDLLDGETVEDIVARWKPERIFHLAAQSSASRSFEQPRLTMESNVIATVNLLEAVRKSAGDARVLVTGSCEEYGNRSPGEMPLDEKTPIEPVSPYASSKASQEIVAMQYHRAFSLNVLLTRSFSHTGPGQTDRFVLPSFARQCAMAAAGKTEPVIRTGNIGVVRDFLDVRDVCDAYVSLAEKGRAGDVYNVCSGKGLKLSDALETMIRIVKTDIRVETDPKLLRPVDVPVLIGDNGKLKRETKWNPAIPTEKMLYDLLSWWERSVLASSA